MFFPGNIELALVARCDLAFILVGGDYMKSARVTALAGAWHRAIIGSLLFMTACAAPTAVLQGFQDTPSRANFTVTDARPDADKTSEILSLWATSCQYGIYRLADARSDPTRMVLLRSDLEAALGSRLRDKTLVVNQYRMYLNKRAPLRDTLNGTYHGVVPGMLAAAGEGCTKEETGDAWFDTSDTDAKAALIVEIQVTLGAKNYTVRSVSGLVSADQSDDSHQIFGALRKANAALVEQLGKDLPAQ
jgi:hypothetical protein